MKKVIIVAILVVVLLLGILFVNLNKEKESISASQFYDLMSSKGYQLQYINIPAGIDYISEAYMATNTQKGYQIEFYEFTDQDYAAYSFNTNVEQLESSEGNVSGSSIVSLKNYSKYTSSTNGKFSVVSQINNTMLYLSVEDTYKNEVKDLLDELGY